LLFSSLKLIHITCAFLSIAGFTLRGYWMLVDNPLLQRRPTKVLPHVIDSLLLGSAIGMLVVWRVSPLQLDWLSAKIVALLLYIGLGMVALRFGNSRKVKVGSFLLALLVAGYIISVAYTKTPLGFLHMVFV
jgi:uncharacterized membrane protein SirB2